MMRGSLVLALFVAIVVASSPVGAEAKLSSAGTRLLKHATTLGNKRSPSKYDRGRFEKLLKVTPREDLLVVAERLGELPDVTPSHLALAERVSGRYWEAVYPGAGAIPGFAAGLAAKEASARAMLLRATFSIEDLTTARKLAVETARWEDPEARLAAAGALVALLDLKADDEASNAAILGLLKDEDPVVKCTAARFLDEAGRKEVLDAYARGLEETTSRTVIRGTDRETFCFGAQAFYRLAELSRRHDAMDHDEYRGKSQEERAKIALDLVSWWKQARPRFSFHDSKWERFAATAIVNERVIDVTRPEDVFFRFRSPSDRSMVTIELEHLDFNAGKGEAWDWVVDWRLSVGIAGARSGFVTVEARRAPANRRHGQPKQGIGRVSVAVQRIGKDRARVVVWFADFMGKREEIR